MEAFPAAYRELFVALYADLRELGELVKTTQAHTPDSFQSMADRLMSFSRSARQLGSTIELGDHLARAVHDIRGGALSALTLELQSLVDERQPEDLQSVAILVCDHMKIMRNLLEGIDEEARRFDVLKRPHSLGTLARALESFLVATGSSTRLGRVVFEDHVLVAESCVEFTALERAAYNLLNNAVAHGGDSVIEIAIAVVGENLRVAVANGLEPTDVPRLSSRLAEDRSLLFRSFSTSGSGHGLRIVADLVGSAYGVPSLDDLVGAGYVGTAISSDHFVAWIHWPLLIS